MSIRKFAWIIYGAALLIVIGFTGHKINAGESIGFNEMLAVGSLLMYLFYYQTWGSKKDKDGIWPEEELGKRISEKSALVSYYLLLLSIFIVVVIDRCLHGTFQPYLLIVLFFGMIILPVVEFFVARGYR